MAIIQVISKIILIISGIAIAFFKAVTELAWGLASIFLLLGLLRYFDMETPALNSTLMNLYSVVIHNIMWFLLAFLIFFCYRYLKEAME